jgi:hypothetical protein
MLSNLSILGTALPNKKIIRPKGGKGVQLLLGWEIQPAAW